MFTRNNTLIAMAIVLAAAGNTLGQNPATRPSEKIRIGTYNTRAVALVYLRSASNDEVAKLRGEIEKAKAAGDEKRVQELMPQGERGQRRAHAQVFSNAPIDNILPKLRDSMPAVAKKANVAAIIPSADWYDPAVELVDVTDLLVEQFKPTAETRKIMAELSKNQPVDLVEAVMMKDW
jgi:hypothetical protein